MPKAKSASKTAALRSKPYELTKNEQKVLDLGLGIKIKDLDDGKDETQEEKKGMSRGQRKRLEKRDRMNAKKRLVESVLNGSPEPPSTESKEIQSSMETLLESSQAQSPQIVSNKQKKSLAVQESLRMKLVQENEAFRSNPIEAVRLFLQQTIKKKE